MANPKRKHSKIRRNKRRRANSLKPVLLSPCSQCGKLCLPHHVCPHCGYYNGKPVIIKKEKKEKKT